MINQHRERFDITELFEKPSTSKNQEEKKRCIILN
jgi:hypothetical protein